MATLTSTKIKNTYDALLKSIDNDAIGTTAKQITDGLGNVTPLYVSTTQVGIGVTPESGLNLHVYGDAKIGSNLTIIGNLVVEGSTTTVGTDTLTVKDPLIVLANNNTSTDAVDIGFYGKYTPSGTTLYSGLFREALTGKYRLFKDLQDEPTTTVNTSGTGYAQATLIAALEGDVTGNITGNVTGNVTGNLTGNVTGNVTGDLTGDVTGDVTGDLTGNVTGGSITATTGLFTDNVNIAGTLVIDDELTVEGSAFGRIEIGGPSGGYIDLKAPHSDDYDLRLITSTGGGELLSIDTLKFYTGATTDLAFTIDASQNATFENNVTIPETPTADTHAASKGYVDAAVEGQDTLAEILANGNTSGGTSMIISDGDDLTVNTNTLKVDSTNSQVGINNASPSGFTDQYAKDLVIGDGTGDRGITIYSSSSAYGSLFFKDAEGSSSANGGFIAYNHFTDGMELGIGNAGLGAGSLSIGSTSIFMKKKLIVDATYSTTNTLTVDPSNARVGIFNDSPSYRLDVSGDARFTGQAIVNSDLVVDTDTLFVDASEDSVGIGLTNPADYTADELVISVPDESGMTLVSGTTDAAYISFADATGTSSLNNYIRFDHNDDTMSINNFNGSIKFSTGEAVDSMTINSSGITIHDEIISNSYATIQSHINIDATVAGDPYISFQQNGTQRASISYDDTEEAFEISTDEFFIKTGSPRAKALTIDSSQNVGIGTDSPDAILEIASGNSGGDAALDAPVFRINNTTESSDWDTGDVVGTIEYYTSDASGNAPYVTSFIKSVNETGNGTLPDGALTFGTATYNASGGAVERMRIDSSGNSTFSGEVTLSAETQYLNFKKASTADVLASIISETDAGTGGKIRILTKRNGDTAIDALTIDDNQNVTIGTGIINPSIGGDIAITQGAIGLRLNDAASAISPTTATANNDNAVDLGVSNIRFKDLYLGGNMSAGRYLNLNNSDYTYIKGTRTSPSDGFYLTRLMGYGDNTFYGSFDVLRHDVNDGELRMRQLVAGTVTDVMTIVDGNVGIGTNLAAEKLHVENGNIRLKSNSDGNNGILRLYDAAGTESGQIYPAAGDLRLYTPNVIIMSPTGNVGIGTTSPDITGFGWNALTVVGGTTAGSAGVLELGAPSTDANDQNYGIIAFMGGTGRNAQIAANRDSATNDGRLSFWTSPGAGGIVERMRIDSSGRVGIGTTSPTYKFEVSNGTQTGTFNPNSSGFMFLGSTSNHSLYFGVNDSTKMVINTSGNVGIGTTSPSYKLDVQVSGNVARFGDGTRFFRVYTDADEVSLLADGSVPMKFYTSGTERMRITSTGNILVGTTGTPNGTSVYGSAFIDGGSGLRQLFQASSTTTSVSIQRFYNPNGNVGSIQTNGSSTSYSTSSDYRLKENVVEMTGALDRVSQLKPSRFNFIADADKTVDGFLAHEVQDIVPEAITGEKDAVDEEGNPEYQGIDQSKLVPLLVGAIQELKAEIELLKTQINN